MIISFKVENNDDVNLGKVKLNLDLKNRSWHLFENKKQIWQRITYSKNGKLELKDWGVIWLYDEMNVHRMIIRDAPIDEFDIKNSNGSTRIYDSFDSSLKDSVFDWEIDLKTMNKIKDANNAPLTDVRKKLLLDLKKVLPCFYMDANYKKVTGGLKKQGGTYTSCGSLPGYVSAQVWRYKTGRMADLNTLKRISMNGTNKVRDRGKQFGCWVEADLIKRPKPGDVYALLDYGKTNRNTDVIGHVGVIQKCVGTKWETADLGQGNMSEGDMEGTIINREYRPHSGELTGEASQGGGFRILAGWVDLDLYKSAI